MKDGSGRIHDLIDKNMSFFNALPVEALFGYSVDVTVIITQCGAPNTADYPLKYAIVAERTPLHLAEDGPRVETAAFGGEKVRISSGRMIIVTRTLRRGLVWGASLHFGSRSHTAGADDPIG